MGRESRSRGAHGELHTEPPRTRPRTEEPRRRTWPRDPTASPTAASADSGRRPASGEEERGAGVRQQESGRTRRTQINPPGERGARATAARGGAEPPTVPRRQETRALTEHTHEARLPAVCRCHIPTANSGGSGHHRGQGQWGLVGDAGGLAGLLLRLSRGLLAPACAAAHGPAVCQRLASPQGEENRQQGRSCSRVIRDKAS